ncbi:MAG: hypothetical protein ACOYK5_02795 [Bacteroidia bacterium]|jgi:hypothetical protein
MKNLTLFLLSAMLVSSCTPEDMALEKLQGRWQAQSLSHPDSVWLKRFDTCGIELAFFPCAQPYTATCSLQIREQGQGGYLSVDTLKYTIKGDELAFVDPTKKPKILIFSSLIFNRRFRWRLPIESQLEWARIDTTVVEFRFQRID